MFSHDFIFFLCSLPLWQLIGLGFGCALIIAYVFSFGSRN